jgi:hypothetical protein
MKVSWSLIAILFLSASAVLYYRSTRNILPLEDEIDAEEGVRFTQQLINEGLKK